MDELERAVETRFPIAERLGRACRKSPVLLYVGGIVVITLMLAALLVAKAYGSPVDIWVLAAIGASVDGCGEPVRGVAW